MKKKSESYPEYKLGDFASLPQREGKKKTERERERVFRKVVFSFLFLKAKEEVYSGLSAYFFGRLWKWQTGLLG